MACLELHQLVQILDSLLEVKLTSFLDQLTFNDEDQISHVIELENSELAVGGHLKQALAELPIANR